MNTARYQRQILLPELGIEGQQKLDAAKVLVIGAGGLGCPALQYLAAAGIGTIGIVDGDVVSISNLHRQALFSSENVGENKALVAQRKLQMLNNEIRINAVPENITIENALTLMADYDIVLDGSDNFPTRYLVNDACVLLDKPLIYGAVSQFEGQVAIFNVADADGVKIQYRDLFPEMPAPGSVRNCAEAGVLGVLPGVIGSLQAMELIKFITHIGDTLVNKLLTYSALTQGIMTIELLPNPKTENVAPKTKEDFEKQVYNLICNMNGQEIDAAKFNEMIDNATIVDVREYGETPAMTNIPHIQIPLSEFEKRYPEIEGDNIIFVCQHGIRSQNAMQYYSLKKGGNQNLYSLQDGVVSLNL